MFVNVGLPNLIMRSQVRRMLHLCFPQDSDLYTGDARKCLLIGLDLNLTMKIGQEELHEALYLQSPSVLEQCLHAEGSQ